MDILKALDKYMLEQSSFSKEPKELYEPIEYILSIGGKRIRPYLCLLACQLFSGDIKAALPAAYALEIFHNFTLLHDDIMDQADIRRGHETVHKKYDTNTAILSGDVMLVYAYEFISKLPKDKVITCLKIFNEIAIGVCEGQQLDVNFETLENVAIQDYINMIYLKTSILIDGAMKIGALVGGASQEEADQLGKYGKNMGIAFQLQDDFLDTFGTTETLGKRVGGDILQNKKTYLYLRAKELSDMEQSKQLLDLYNRVTHNLIEEDNKINEVKTLFNNLAIQDEMHLVIEKYRSAAADALDALELDETKKKAMLDLLDMVVKRKH